MFGNLGFQVDWSNAPEEELEIASFDKLCAAFRQCNDILIKMRRDLLLGKDGITQEEADKMKEKVLFIIRLMSNFIDKMDEEDMDPLESVMDLLFIERRIIYDRRKNNFSISKAKMFSEEESLFYKLIEQVQRKHEAAILNNKDHIDLPEED